MRSFNNSTYSIYSNILFFNSANISNCFAKFDYDLKITAQFALKVCVGFEKLASKLYVFYLLFFHCIFSFYRPTASTVGTNLTRVTILHISFIGNSLVFVLIPKTKKVLRRVLHRTVVSYICDATVVIQSLTVVLLFERTMA